MKIDARITKTNVERVEIEPLEFLRLLLEKWLISIGVHWEAYISFPEVEPTWQVWYNDGGSGTYENIRAATAEEVVIYRSFKKLFELTKNQVFN